MNNRLTAAALTLAHFALIGGLAATTLATPAQAQGTTSAVPKEGKVCPSGWAPGKSHTPMVGFDLCKPMGSNAPAIYLKTGSTCAAGYRVESSWCTTLPEPKEFVQSSSGESLVKPSKGDRCPTGFFTNNTGGNPGLECITKTEPSVISRPKGGKPCKANEVDEWGLWCTSNYEHLTSEQMQSWALKDYNNIYSYNRGVPTVVVHKSIDDLTYDDIKGTPVHTKVYGTVPEGTSSSTSSASNGTDSGQANPVRSCKTAEQQGAAIGGALGGAKGKALGGLAGSALGGLGKKKSGC